MTESQMLDEFRLSTGSTEEDLVLLSFLNSAKRRILNRLYPFSENPVGLGVPERYHMLQVEIATFLMNKRGAEGEVQHNENGVSRTYGGSDVPSALMAEITPMCAIPG